jgi:HPt (histidine-containing phosphotransfer) domain-containing protein
MPRSSLSSLNYRVARNEILDELRATVDDADLEIILSVFETDAEAQLNDLHDFATAGKYEPARRVAHRLAGLLAQFGATSAAELAHRMAASTSDPGDAVAIANLLSACRKAVAEICSGTHDCSPIPEPLTSPAFQPTTKVSHRMPQTLPPQMAADLAAKVAMPSATHRRRSEPQNLPDS